MRTWTEADQSVFTFTKTFSSSVLLPLSFTFLFVLRWVLRVFWAKPELLHKVWSEVPNSQQVLILPGWAAAQCGNDSPAILLTTSRGRQRRPRLVEKAGLWTAYVALVVTSISCAPTLVFERCVLGLYSSVDQYFFPPFARDNWWQFSYCVLLCEWGIVFGLFSINGTEEDTVQLCVFGSFLDRHTTKTVTICWWK